MGLGLELGLGKQSGPSLESSTRLVRVIVMARARVSDRGRGRGRVQVRAGVRVSGRA